MKEMKMSFIDENGNKLDYEILGIEVYDKKVYCVCYPTDNLSTEVAIYRVEEKENTDHDEYYFVDDPEIANKVFEKFKERTKDIYKFI